MDKTIPRDFFWRRLHSLTGFFFVLFLIQHLLVNSQAALFVGDDGEGFVRAVNAIHNFAYLPLIEIFLLGVPILIHMIWGIKYLQTSQPNTFHTDGSAPCLAGYARNQAYTWQRITSWILLIGVLAHVVQMRFIEEPLFVKAGAHHYYFVRVQKDAGLASLAERLDVKLLDQADLQAQPKAAGDALTPKDAVDVQHDLQHQQWREALSRDRPLKEGQVLVQAADFGTAELLMVRETFKMPLMLALYTIFVLSACFHAFNGLWTFMIKWGVTLTVRSQELMLKASIFLMVLVGFMGLAAIWGTYWLNLKQ